MGALNFTIVFESKGAGYFDALAGLCKDFSVPFQNIINEWAKHNVEKFRRGKGAELSGTEQSSDVYWAPLTEQYYRSKHGATEAKRRTRRMAGTAVADWLMVRTGDLMRSLTGAGGFVRYVGPTKAIFGQPLDPEDAQKVAGNWMKRQVLFLDLTDKRMIRAHISDYLKYGSDYMGARRQLAAEKARAKREYARMEMEFSETMRNL